MVSVEYGGQIQIFVGGRRVGWVGWFWAVYGDSALCGRGAAVLTIAFARMNCLTI